MFQGLKITIHDIKRCPPKVLKASPDYNLHVFLAAILLDHASIPDLVGCPEYPVVAFTPPSLNPKLVKLYNKYHDKGFEIYGVSLDEDAKSWKKAVRNDKLSWIQLW